jgi:hypothetical protein
MKIGEAAKAKLEEITSYPLLKFVGTPLSGDVKTVPTWETAARECKSDNWQRCCIMGRNVLQRLTEQRAWDRSDRWDEYVEAIRPRIVSCVEDLRSVVTAPVSIFEKVRHNIAWNLLFICLEAEYSDVVEPIFFIPYVDKWYQCGHFPCGWNGLPFPDGWDGIIRGGNVIVF